MKVLPVHYGDDNFIILKYRTNLKWENAEHSNITGRDWAILVSFVSIAIRRLPWRMEIVSEYFFSSLSCSSYWFPARRRHKWICFPRSFGTYRRNFRRGCRKAWSIRSTGDSTEMST